MAFEIQAFILVLTLSVSFTYSIEVAPAGSPTELGRKGMDGVTEEAAKENMVKNVKTLLPKYEEFLHSLKDRVGMITEINSASEECVIHSCLFTFQTEYSDLQKLVEVAGKEEFEPTADARELEHCKACLVEVAKEDPEFGLVVSNFKTEVDAAEIDVNKFNS